MTLTFRRRTILGGLPVALAAAGARAQSLTDIDDREAAVIEAWDKTPLTVRRAIFVVQKAAGFGMYEERPNNVFRPGEPLIIYAEPVGYGWRTARPGIFEFGFAVDFVVRSSTGDVLGGKQDFARLVEQSHVRNIEFMLSLSLDLKGAPPADYVLAYQLRDVTGPKTASFELPFSIKA